MSLQTTMAIIGILIFLFFFAPVMCRNTAFFGGNNIQLR